MSDSEIINLFLLTILVLLVPSWRRAYFFPKAGSEKAETVNKRIEYFDFLRGISILAVIVIHIGYIYDQHPDFASYETLSDLISNLARFCIPIFIICSGVLLTPWREISDRLGFYKKKFFRIFLPYILVVTFIAAYHSAPLKTSLYALISGQAAVPYYFIINLLQLYLLYPLLSLWRQKPYLLPFVFSVSGLIIIFFPGIFFLKVPIAIDFLFFFAYGIYRRDFFLGGGQIKRPELYMWLALIAAYLLIAIILPGRYYNFQVFYGLAIFNVLYYYKETLIKQFDKLFRFFVHLGTYSLWIYLIHIQIEEAVYNILLEYLDNFYLNYALIGVITLILSYLGARGLSFLYNKALKTFHLA